MDSFTLTISHLQSPIFYLATVAAGSNLRPPFSIFDLTSGADGWALGSTICILHLLSPHFGPCCCSAICNPQSQSSIFSLEWGTGQEGFFTVELLNFFFPDRHTSSKSFYTRCSALPSAGSPRRCRPADPEPAAQRRMRWPTPRRRWRIRRAAGRS